MGKLPITLYVVVEEGSFAHLSEYRTNAEAFSHRLQFSGGGTVPAGSKKVHGEILGEAEDVFWRNSQFILLLLTPEPALHDDSVDLKRISWLFETGGQFLDICQKQRAGYKVLEALRGPPSPNAKDGMTPIRKARGKIPFHLPAREG